MIVAELPKNERRRLAELYALDLLDSSADPAFDAVTRLAQRLFGVPIALVSLVDADRQWFKSRQGLDAEETPRDVAFCAHAIHGDDVFVVEDATLDPRFFDNPLVEEAPSVRFYAGAPLHAPNGHRLGTLCVIDNEPRELTQQDLSTLRDLSEIIEKEIAQAAAAVTDSLTGLHNRRGFVTAATQLLASAGRSGEPVVLVYADLDGLKQINDTDGHAAGDAAICAAAALMQRSVREADLLARMGGDEFALILYGTDAATIDVPVGRLRDAIAHYNDTAKPTHPVGLSVGWVEWKPGESLEALLARGDAAMYEIKQAAATSRGATG